MNPLWILAAFIFGAVISRIGLPPLVGYLLAGFALNSIGVTGGEILETVANAGVTLLLFTIGLKLKIKSLAKPEVWAGTSIHMIVTVIIFGFVIWMLGSLRIAHFDQLTGQTALLIAFALSFSSTVFAVKVLEGKNEMASRHAAAAIGILIMQDIIAVIFLAASTGKIPSAWAALLFVSLFIARPFLGRLMAMCGHGELLMLFGTQVELTSRSAILILKSLRESAEMVNSTVIAHQLTLSPRYATRSKTKQMSILQSRHKRSCNSWSRRHWAHVFARPFIRIHSITRALKRSGFHLFMKTLFRCAQRRTQNGR